MNFDLVVRGGTLVTADAVFPADVGIIGDKIAAVVAPATPMGAVQTLDATGCYVLPGAIDAHVHLHMPTAVGYTADDWRTGTTAAALGGTTTLVDFVETQPTETLLDALHKRLDETHDAVIDFGLHMTLQPDEHPIQGIPRRISAGRISQIREAYDAGCATFKMYQAYPGFQVQDADLLRALFAIREVGGMACIHSENGDVIEVLRGRAGQEDDGRPTTDDGMNDSSSVVGRPSSLPLSSAYQHALTRPPANEHESVTRAVMCAEISGARVLIFHIGCAAAAQVVAEARARGLAGVYGETCPQYLVLTDAQLQRDDGRLWICAPPLRPQADQDAMWNRLASRALDFISTDHCPFTRQQKDAGRDDFRLTPGGVPGIEARLGLVHHFGVRAGRLSLSDWVRLCCTRPAELHALHGKGRIAVGFDADLVIFDPALRKSLSAGQLHSAIDWSAYEGMTCEGWPREVLSRGEVIVRAGQFMGQAGRGRFLHRAF